MSTFTNIKNSSDNINWLEKSAEKGNEGSMHSLALRYYYGEGIEKDLEMTFHWFQKAAEKGYERSMHGLAYCYKNGEGTEKDMGMAFHWYQKAAEKGYERSMHSLALHYENGEGTEKDLGMAFYWYQKAAEKGYERSMHCLAYCYNNGEGTEKDLGMAFYWYQKVAAKGNEESMNSLALCYYNGEGTEKDLGMTFHWYQKAAEKGYERSMYNLAYCYENGEGTEKDLRMAFYWYQKAAEKGYEESMHHFALCYYKGEGTEKDLEMTFYWFQKAAKKGHERSMHNLALCYYKGEGTEKDLRMAFHWYQKAAEKDQKMSIHSLASCYYYGEGTEKDLEMAFHWFQKAAEKGHEGSMLYLALCYENGEGIEKNLEKAFYWYKMTPDNFKINNLCKKCNQPYIDFKWCQQCNIKQFQQDFSKWTSKNKFIDKFIQEAQLNAKSSYEVLEWIPYNKLNNINYYDKGGFSEIYRAIWLDGPIDSWNFDEQQWNRWAENEVILKNLNNSSSLSDEFLDEWKHHYNCQKKSFSKFIQFFGISQDPNNLNYMIIMSYAKKGSLKKCLSNIGKFKWQTKLQLLKKIILGLKVIHESELTHCDFHDGNILISDDYNEIYIIDLGLCKPIQHSDDKIDSVYGIIPYMAPEILRNNPYTPASDIYSFSMIMWEFTSGIPPFNNKAHDVELILSILLGFRSFQKTKYNEPRYEVPNIDNKLKSDIILYKPLAY
ncbi:kinase-like domain-containing protein [Rhizophagus irregularis DAOM 181602=DAOM 197198]|nr:kinase-like domain-containing protein [Rhizophagus irregularis DAOM 181602=DAOM 197198]